MMQHFVRTSFILTAFTFLYSLCFAQNQYQAPKASIAPVIDGAGSDACWTNAPWYNVDQLWLGVQPSASDFSERFKVSWDANKLYVLGEVTDDVLNDNYVDPLSNYWEDDTWEVFIDENASGGDHEKSYNAFAYHISKALDAVDIGVDGNPHLYNTHVNIKRTADGTKYTWEAAFDVYTDAFVLGAVSNPKATLAKGKIMGFALAYCDNDGGTTRQSFMGSEFVPGTDKNQAYKNASYFGKVELVDAITPTFTRVMVASGLANPSAMTVAPDGRIFVCEQEGNLRVIKNGTLLTAPALTVNVNLGNEFYSERGLLGVTVDPDFADNNYIYVFYTTSPNGKFVPEGARNKVSRFTLNGDVAVAGSETTILLLDPLSTAINHNGGTLHFGKDGKLYIATGENFTQANAQNLDVTHGKILRLNQDGTIPTDNPFTTGTTQKKMIWAYGLRNPFTFDVQPGTGKIFLNDVGQDMWEEIDDATIGGKNFGWPVTEGATTEPGIEGPVLTYHHSDTPTDTTGCAITGGVFFNPAASNYPSKYLGKYFYADYCNNWISVMDPSTGKRMQVFASNVAGAPVALDIHPDGNLYFLSRTAGAVYKITYSGSPAPDILAQPISISTPESQPASFKVVVNGATPIFYQWNKNGTPIVGANTDTYLIPAAIKADSGKYSVTISNSYDTITSNEVKLTVTAFNSRPVASIVSPTTGTEYAGGDSFIITGTGTDTQDGTLPASAFTWKVIFHHDTHVHDGISSTGSKTLNLIIPSTGETATDVFYRVYLFVKDQGGLTDTSYVDLLPKIVNLSFATVPAGLTVLFDGQPVKTPFSSTSVVGVIRNIGVVTPQTANSKGWKFVNWSNGGPEIQSLATPTANAFYTATFNEAPITKETIPPLQDAYVTNSTSFAPDGGTTTYGTTDSTNLVVKTFTEGPNRQAYLTFDLSKLTGKLDHIKSATLKISASMTDEDAVVKSVIAQVYESKTTTWSEKSITWNTKPGNNLTSLANFTVTNLTSSVYQITLTDYIKAAALSASKQASIVLVASSNSKNRVAINSKENDLNKPQLLLEYDITTDLEYNEESTTNVFQLFPNPATKTVQVLLSTKEMGEATIEILNAASSTLTSQKVNINSYFSSFPLDIQHLVPGLYLVNIRQGNQQFIQKLVVE